VAATLRKRHGDIGVCFLEANFDTSGDVFHWDGFAFENFPGWSFVFFSQTDVKYADTATARRQLPNVIGWYQSFTKTNTLEIWERAKDNLLSRNTVP
jgi:hypothetical protein